MHQSYHAEIGTSQGQIFPTKYFPTVVCTRQRRVVSHKCVYLLATHNVLFQNACELMLHFLVLHSEPSLILVQLFVGWPEACGTGNQESTCQIDFVVDTCARGHRFQNFQRRWMASLVAQGNPAVDSKHSTLCR